MTQHTSVSSLNDTIKDDDLLRVYLRQVGNLMRLDHEEEYFHINEFYQAREELKRSLCFFPKLFKERIEVSKTSEILENQSKFEKELNLKPQMTEGI